MMLDHHLSKGTARPTIIVYDPEPAYEVDIQKDTSD